MSQKTAADISIQLLLQVNYMDKQSLGRQLRHPSVFLQELLNIVIDGLLKERKSSQLFFKVRCSVDIYTYVLL